MELPETEQRMENIYPGLGLPVTHVPKDSPAFPNAVNIYKDPSNLRDYEGPKGWGSEGITLREKRMMAFINGITDKPDWETKVFDEAIVKKWKSEAEAQPTVNADVFMSEKMFDFCIKELRDKASIFKSKGHISVFDAELSILKSDTVVPDSLRSALCKAVKVLEDVPDHKQDWHPGSDGQVLDLVHPSLFPVIFGLTRALPTGRVPLEGCVNYTGKGLITETLKVEYERPCLWNSPPNLWGSFQWLPTDVQLTDSGVKLLGYINNLHPVRHAAIYNVLEQIVSVTVPMWEECLNGHYTRLRIPLHGHGNSRDWSYPKYHVPGQEEGDNAWYNAATKRYSDTIDGEEKNYGPGIDDDWQFEDGFYSWMEENRVLLYPEPRAYTAQDTLPRRESATRNPAFDYIRRKCCLDEEYVDPEVPVVNFRGDFPEGLQIIFKLANIHLSPEKPAYPGGSWHVGGALNEHICASSIYYYDQDNVTESRLAFRQTLDHDLIREIPQQNEWDSIEAYLGVQQGGDIVQDLGSVVTREGRVLVFPNCIQHQVQPFSLKDKTKPGHRKILAMFLIDPNRRVLSTSHVPPQRRDWWADEVRNSRALNLPPELVDLITGMVDDFPISWDQALKIRKHLMDERGAQKGDYDEHLAEQVFNFCEH